MKAILKITGFAMMFLLTGSSALNAQFARGLGYSGYCMFQNLSGLTDKQKTELATLTGKHWTQMEAVTKEILEATDWGKKNEAAIKLQNIRLSHRNEVMNLLTDEQKNSLLMNNSLYLAGGGRGMGPCGAGLGPGGGRGRGINQVSAYGFGRGRGRGIPQVSGYGLGRAW